MPELNKKIPELPRMIEWIFFCTSAVPNEIGGLDIQNLSRSFNRSSLFALTIVFKMAFQPSNDADEMRIAGRTYRLHDEWLLQLVIEDQADAQLYSHQTEVIYADQIIGLSFDPMPAMEAGHYLVKILVDGFLEHSLDLFIV